MRLFRGFWIRKELDMKKAVILAAVLAIFACSGVIASAKEKVGFVDMAKIMTTSKKAQDVSSDIKSQQDEIQKMINDARIRIMAAETEEERKELEKKLSEKIQLRNNDFKADYEKKVTDLQDTISLTVEKIAKQKKMEFIFRKDNIVFGGQDITEDVISQLNK